MIYDISRSTISSISLTLGFIVYLFMIAKMFQKLVSCEDTMQGNFPLFISSAIKVCPCKKVKAYTNMDASIFD